MFGYGSYAFALICEDEFVCACVTPDECYQTSEKGVSMMFAPYCEAESCGIYLLFLGSKMSSMVPKGGKGWEFFYEPQEQKIVGAGEFVKLPGPYRKIKSVGCGECPLMATSC
uniref:AMP_N domain-containing protein n=1 Tax=Steinernema glaseri TaxID=37863 RepID=A0A1I7Y7S6_9BILA